MKQVLQLDPGRAPEVTGASALRLDAQGPLGLTQPQPSLLRLQPLLLASGADVPYVMAQAGHSDPKMTLGLYAKFIVSKTDHGAALDSLVASA